eukprot:scaffold82130_cov21-Tisochrysis_lutea.AAC.2
MLTHGLTSARPFTAMLQCVLHLSRTVPHAISQHSLSCFPATSVQGFLLATTSMSAFLLTRPYHLCTSIPSHAPLPLPLASSAQAQPATVFKACSPSPLRYSLLFLAC